MPSFGLAMTAGHCGSSREGARCCSCVKAPACLVSPARTPLSRVSNGRRTRPAHTSRARRCRRTAAQTSTFPSLLSAGAADLTAACRGAGGVAARGVAAVRGLSASSLRIKRQRDVLPLLAFFDGAVAEWQRRAAALPQHSGHSGLGAVHDAQAVRRPPGALAARVALQDDHLARLLAAARDQRRLGARRQEHPRAAVRPCLGARPAPDRAPLTRACPCAPRPRSPA